LRTRSGRLDRCLLAMRMQLPRAVVWSKLRAVGRALA
jgi:hypothetical protein